MRLLEKELAPSFLIMVLIISVGAFHLAALFTSLFIILLGVLLLIAYQTEIMLAVKLGRICLFLMTCILFSLLIAADHVFDKTTLPQVVELHMTKQAMVRHGADTMGMVKTPIFIDSNKKIYKGQD